MVLPLLIPLAKILIAHGGAAHATATAAAHAGAVHAGAGAGLLHAGGGVNMQQIVLHYGKNQMTGQMRAKAREFARANCKNRDDLEFILRVIDTYNTVGEVVQVLQRSGRLN